MGWRSRQGASELDEPAIQGASDLEEPARSPSRRSRQAGGDCYGDGCSNGCGDGRGARFYSMDLGAGSVVGRLRRAGWEQAWAGWERVGLGGLVGAGLGGLGGGRTAGLASGGRLRILKTVLY